MVIKNLVLSGAELRGITYIGVIRAIEDLSIYDSLENILGVSSGAIFAMTLVLELSSIQLEKIIMSISLEQLFNFKTDDILNIAETFGIDDGEKITKIFKVLFRKILKNENATFKDLHNLNPKKNLIISGTNLSNKNCDYFSYETTPDMPLHIALRISISIPLCFKAIKYNDNLYIDGAFSNNFPINYFTTDIDNTLGVMISSVKSSNQNIDALSKYMLSVTDCVLGIMPNYLKHLYKQNIVEIKVEYNILEFKFNQNVKRYLIDTGYQQFKEQYIELFGDTHSSETSKSDIKSTKENLDEIIEDMNREIKVINEKKINLSDKIINE